MIDGIAEAELGAKRSRLHDRPIEIRLLERISEAQLQFFQDRSAGVQRDRAPRGLRHWPQLIDAVTMVAVRVSDDHAVETPDPGRKQLLAKVRAAVDKHVLTGALNQGRGPEARIPRLGRVALAPVIPDLRHAGRRAATENADLHAAWALLKN